MTDGKQDLRVRKTRKALSVALLSLLEETGFSKISVNDICSLALVSRSAFYDHFTDKYDLLSYCVSEVKQTTLDETQGMGIAERMPKVLAHVREHAQLFKNLLSLGFDRELTEMFRRSFQKDFEDDQGIGCLVSDFDGPTEVASLYYAAAITSVILYWLERNLPYTEEEMASYLLQLIPREAMMKHDGDGAVEAIGARDMLAGRGAI